MEIPQPTAEDPEAVVTALETAAVFGAQGDAQEALRWVRRAAEAASDDGNDLRALALARSAADLSNELQQASNPPPESHEPEASSGAAESVTTPEPAPGGTAPEEAAEVAAPIKGELEPPPPPPPPRPRTRPAAPAKPLEAQAAAPSETVPEAPPPSLGEPKNGAAAAAPPDDVPSDEPTVNTRPSNAPSPLSARLGVPPASTRVGAPPAKPTSLGASAIKPRTDTAAPANATASAEVARGAAAEAAKAEAARSSAAEAQKAETARLPAEAARAEAQKAEAARLAAEAQKAEAARLAAEAAAAEATRAEASQAEAALVASEVAKAEAIKPVQPERPSKLETTRAPASRLNGAAHEPNPHRVGLRQAVRVSIAPYPDAPGFFVVRPLEDHQVPGQGAREALVVLLDAGGDLFTSQSE